VAKLTPAASRRNQTTEPGRSGTHSVRFGALGWSRRARYAIAFALLGLLAFGPALAAPFDFDDGLAISENTSIRQLWPPSVPLRPPAHETAVSGRPVVNYSFALNYALNRWIGIDQAPRTDAPTQTVGYHAVNLLLHVAAALLLFAIVRRTIHSGLIPESWRDAADRIAALTAGIWLLHPIQAEAVDYVSQRTELLVSLCYLGTLYAAIRAWQEKPATRSKDQVNSEHVLRWSVVSVASCLLGMGSKEVMITAPLMVVLYDRAFLAADWVSLWRDRHRRWLYGALLATGILVVALLAGGSRGTTVGAGSGITWYSYLYTQAWAIPHYVRLLLWPDGLTFDYGRTPIHGYIGIPGLVALGIVGVATLLAWRSDRWRWFGFLGAWFFLILAPSSSIIPIRTEMAAERRVYLAIAAVIVFLVIAGEYARRELAGPVSRQPLERTPATRRVLWALIGVGVVYVAADGWTASHLAPSSMFARWSLRLAIAAVATALAWSILFARSRVLRLAAIAATGSAMVATTFHRSGMYDDLVVRWRDAVEKTPANGRAYDNLASALLRADPPQIAAADSVLHRAMAADPSFVPARVRGATIAIAQNRWVDAETLLVHALQIHPGDAAATDKLGDVLIALRRPDLALPYVRQFSEFSGTSRSLTRLGLTYLMIRQLDSAIIVLKRAAQLDSTQIDARRYLAAALVEQERGTEALPYIEQALRLDPTSGLMFGLLSLAFAQSGQADSAAHAAETATAKAPDNPTVYVFAGRAMQSIGRFSDAATYLRRAVVLNPNDPQALSRLGMAEASMGHSVIAAQIFHRVLMSVPDYPLARQGIEQLRHARP
jgi:tetratricopeptide (TPR) repeat protein